MSPAVNLSKLFLIKHKTSEKTTSCARGSRLGSEEGGVERGQGDPLGGLYSIGPPMTKYMRNSNSLTSVDVDLRHFIIMQTHNNYRENITGSLND